MACSLLPPLNYIGCALDRSDDADMRAASAEVCGECELAPHRPFDASRSCSSMLNLCS